MRYLTLILAFVFGIALFSSAQEGSRSFRPLHYLSTDKQIYHPGEVVYMRDVVLDAQTNYPVAESLSGWSNFRWKINSPRGEEAASGSVEYESSVGAMTWKIPDDVAGGYYTLRVEGHDGAPAERSFQVRAYRTPRIRTQIDFLKRGYLPGEEVTAAVVFRRAEGDALENPRISATAILDGKIICEVEEVPVQGDSAQVTFQLPKEISEGDGTLNFTILDGGVLESAGKSIPVLLSNYTVEFYPEGGDLAIGVLNRVYVEARQKNGIGADIAGKIVTSETHEQVAEFAAVFDGRGIFEFVPQAGVQYQLEVPNEVTGETRVFPLPSAKPGVALSATKPVYAFQEPIALKIQSAPGSPAAETVVLRKRDQEFGKATLAQGQTEVTLPAGEMEGVLIATVYAKDGTPLAERLIFRQPKYKVHAVVEGLEKDYVPGDKVTLTLVTTDDAGTPVAANLGVAVTDASVVNMVDRRDLAPRLPAMVYLENEVLSFADAGDYFNPADTLAPVKIDLLLGTQGWRRFVPVRKKIIAEEYSNDALQRILAPIVTIVPPSPRRRLKAMGRRANGVDEEFEMDLICEELVCFAAAPMNEDRMMAAMADGAQLPPPVPVEAVPPVVEEQVVAEVPARAVMAKQMVLDVRREEPILWTREYAHKARQDRKPGDRVDFAETIYWCANVKTDPRTGKAQVSFDLPDTVGAFQVAADAFGSNGALGEFTSELKSVQPFYAEVKLPCFLTTGDQAILPITLVNATQEPLPGVNLVLECGEKLRVVEKPEVGGAPLAPGERRALFAKVEAVAPGEVSLQVKAVAGGNADAVTRKLTVLSPLFPFALSAGARVSKESPLVFAVSIPGKVENGSQKVTAQVYSSPAATMEAALNALLRQPCGCFEQTSSTNYPLVMAQQYFLSHSGCDPETISKAQGLLDEGYKKLVSFECSKKGYEWFGDDPGHEALSAYGLMEFADMAQVMPVDQKMIGETRQWILGRRDGQGGFLRNDKALDSFGRAPAETTDAYILWALLESGEKSETLQKEIDAVCRKAAEGKDDYRQALAANILFLAGDKAGAERFCEMLAADQQKDGTMANPGTTITCSGELSQKLECTALAALAWVRCGARFSAQTECAMKMLAECCQAGKFGSTQSTVLVLKAINAYDATFAKPKAPGNAQLWVDGKPFGAPVEFTEKSMGILALPDCGLALGPGEHTVEIRLTGESELTCSVQVEGMTRQKSDAGVLRLTTALDRQTVTEGDPLQLDVTLQNTDSDVARMPLAVVAIPGGLEPRPEQLKELVDAGRIAAFELTDNTVVLYWRHIPALESVKVPISLTASIPGDFTAAASRAYLYYTDEAKAYQPGVDVKILPARR